MGGVAMRMDKQHSEWEDFLELLEGPEGCNFQGVAREATWQCAGGRSKIKAEGILIAHWPDVDVGETLSYFEDHGGYCDCEILFNVA